MDDVKNISDIAQEFCEKHCDNVIITALPGFDNPDTLVLTTDTYMENLKRYLFDLIGLDEVTVEWLTNSTESERQEIKRFSQIAYHKKQIELLTNK